MVCVENVEIFKVSLGEKSKFEYIQAFDYISKAFKYHQKLW
jgi:hypothetical protein